MSVIDAAVAHYKANAEQFVDVPEWVLDGQPIRIYWRLLTFDVCERLFKNPGRT